MQRASSNQRNEVCSTTLDHPYPYLLLSGANLTQLPQTPIEQPKESVCPPGSKISIGIVLSGSC